jgi:hypothetical protein
MRGSADAGSRYLSLALLTRATMNKLSAVVGGQPVGEELSSALDRLLSGFKLQQGPNYLAQLQAGAPASSFEELSTLAALYAKFKAENVANTFSDVLSNGDEVTRRESAKKLISFLGAVESKALNYYSQALQHQTS